MYLTVFSYEGRDWDAGIHGTIQPGVEPFATAASREAIVAAAWAQLGRDPLRTVYIANRQNQVLEQLRNTEYDAAERAQTERHFIAWSLVFLCLLTFVGTLALDLGVWGLGIFVLIGGQFVLQIKTRFHNGGEALLASVLLLVMSLASASVWLGLPPPPPADAAPAAVRVTPPDR